MSSFVRFPICASYCTLSLLSEKAKEVLEKLRDNQSELNDLNECEVFVCGFRLGARIMLEVLDGSDKWGEFEE